ncbi:Phosphatidylglycerophosphatase A [compost metagenome]
MDKLKPGVLARLNDKSTGQVHTYLDDIVGAIAAAASSRIAHRKQAEREQELGLPHAPEDVEEAARKTAEDQLE